jgi:hypothetical protein
LSISSLCHSPQQNGRAEHFNRTIMEKASAMLHHAGMSQGFWETAVATACHLYNRTPTHSNKWRTPLELWNGTIPDVSYFRVYGCKAYYHVPDHNDISLILKQGKLSLWATNPIQRVIRCGTAIAGLSSLHEMLHLTKRPSHPDLLWASRYHLFQIHHFPFQTQMMPWASPCF